MSKLGQKLLRALVAACWIPVLLFSVPVTRGTQEGPLSSASVVACRVLEAHASPELHVTLVLFHQQEEKDRVRLGNLLRQHSGASVELQTADGAWHTASVVRLKSCFGRGLLLFSAGTAQLQEKQEFLLRFPST